MRWFKTIRIITVLSLFITEIAFSQNKITERFNSTKSDFWEVINTPDSIKIRAIGFDNENNILIGAGNNVHAGIYRSTDLGDSWELLYYQGNIDTACYIVSLAVNDSGHIYAGTGGFYSMIKSTDNGGSWDSLFHYSSDVGTVYQIKTFGVDTIYISSTWSNETHTAKLLRSIDSGSTWDTLFKTGGYAISDFEVLSNGDIYLSQTRYGPQSGNIYMTSDTGDTWEYVGLEGHYITAIEFNKFGDLIAGEWCGNIYRRPFGEDEFITSENWICTEDIKINSDGHIFIGSDYPNGMLRSTDNTLSFHKINSGLNWGSLHMGAMEFDENEYLFASQYSSKNLAKTVDSTTVHIRQNETQVDLSVKPNPFSTTTTIEYNLDQPYEVTLSIFNHLGEQVEMIRQQQSSGKQQVTWNAEGLPPGMYFFTLKAGEQVGSGKMVLVQ